MGRLFLLVLPSLALDRLALALLALALALLTLDRLALRRCGLMVLVPVSGNEAAAAHGVAARGSTVAVSIWVHLAERTKIAPHV